MKEWRRNGMAAVLFVGLVAMTSRSSDPLPQCWHDGLNWAAVSVPCRPNEKLKLCSDHLGDASCPAIVYTGRYDGNFKCFPSEPIGGQNTNCIRPKNPDGSDMERNCLDRQACEVKDIGDVFPDNVCQNKGQPTTITEPVWTSTPCKPFVGPPPPDGGN